MNTSAFPFAVETVGDIYTIVVRFGLIPASATDIVVK